MKRISAGPKAVILAGGFPDRAWHARVPTPTLLLPLAGATLLERQCRWLGAQGIDEVAVLAAGRPDAASRRRFERAAPPGVELRWAREPGAAAALRSLRGWLGPSGFVLLPQDLLPTGLDLGELIEEPWRGDTRVRLFVRPRDPISRRAVGLDRRGCVVRPPRHPGWLAPRRSAESLEVFYCHPELLDQLPDSGPLDPEPDFVSAVLDAGLRVESRPARGPALRLEDPADYLAATSLLLRRGEVGEQDRRIDAGVWARGTAEIATSAQIQGPVLLDEAVVIGERARIIGPTYLGAKVWIGDDATVCESALWEGSEVGESAQVEASIVARGQKVASGESLVSRLRHDYDVEIDRVAWSPDDPVRVRGRREAYETAKRAFDAAFAALGLLLCAPLFVAIALAIRLGSPGPVFYRETRCGRFGRKFRILKFRTMTVGAEREQAGLRRANGCDGPMFKLEQDPRVTGVGCFLRRWSLDELPQLVNVVRGEMSLVGPRPLRLEEMSRARHWRELRLTVPAGITGLWQLRARRSRVFADWIEHDLAYVLGPPTLWGDLEILVATLVGLATGRIRGE